jgi:hypothetical protein
MKEIPLRLAISVSAPLLITTVSLKKSGRLSVMFFQPYCWADAGYKSQDARYNIRMSVFIEMIFCNTDHTDKTDLEFRSFSRFPAQ